jgi:hypothetical protein
MGAVAMAQRCSTPSRTVITLEADFVVTMPSWFGCRSFQLRASLGVAASRNGRSSPVRVRFNRKPAASASASGRPHDNVITRQKTTGKGTRLRSSAACPSHSHFVPTTVLTSPAEEQSYDRSAPLLTDGVKTASQVHLAPRRQFDHTASAGGGVLATTEPRFRGIPSVPEAVTDA